MNKQVAEEVRCKLKLQGKWRGCRIEKVGNEYGIVIKVATPMARHKGDEHPKMTKRWVNPYSLHGVPSKFELKPKDKSQRSTLKCNFCGKVFTRVIGPKTYEISCPKCKEIDVDVMNPGAKTHYDGAAYWLEEVNKVPIGTLKSYNYGRMDSELNSARLSEIYGIPNPGEDWHGTKYEEHASKMKKAVQDNDIRSMDNEIGAQRAHFESYMKSRSLGMSNPRPRLRNLSVPEQHQLKIARKTLTYSDVGARIMGGPNKEEARLIIYKLTGRWPKENPIARAVRPKFKLGKLLLPAIVIGAIIWFARKS